MPLTRAEALLAAEVAERYPAGTRRSAWGYSGVFAAPLLIGDPHEVAGWVTEHPQSRRYG